SWIKPLIREVLSDFPRSKSARKMRKRILELIIVRCSLELSKLDSRAAMARRVTLSLRHESPVAYSLDFQGRPLLRFQDSGQRCRLSSIDPGPFKHFDILRWGAPFALAPQGIVSLHASCIMKGGLAIAFLGTGGTGKSTLARRLRDRGWERL